VIGLRQQLDRQKGQVQLQQWTGIQQEDHHTPLHILLQGHQHQDGPPLINLNLQQTGIQQGDQHTPLHILLQGHQHQEGPQQQVDRHTPLLLQDLQVQQSGLQIQLQQRGPATALVLGLMEVYLAATSCLSEWNPGLIHRLLVSTKEVILLSPRLKVTWTFWLA